MPAPPVTVSTSGPGFAKIRADMKRVRGSDILVGVPSDRTQRKGEPITNASLMFIHSAGSPLRGIPARPTIQPAIEQNRSLITPELAKAAQALMQNNPAQAEKYMHRAGTIAVNATKRMFGSSQLVPNAPSVQKRKGARLRPPQMVNNPLIDTAALRRSQTHVVRVFGRQPIEASKED